MQAMYRERTSWLHAWPASAKLAVLAGAGTALFLIDHGGVLVGAAAAAGGILLSLRPLGSGTLRLLRALALAALLVVAFHACSGQPAWGIVNGARLLCVSMLGMAFTLSTRHGEVLDVFERLLAPLAFTGVRGDRIGLQLALMLRFTELFFAQWQRLDDSHRARVGAPGRLRLLAPLTIQMLLGARRVGDAVQLRLHDSVSLPQSSRKQP